MVNSPTTDFVGIKIPFKIEIVVSTLSLALFSKDSNKLRKSSGHLKVEIPSSTSDRSYIGEKLAHNRMKYNVTE